ncbi:PREDICTED: MLO-like protein 5 [Erythranthe guttata]|uniref:MLO-like protein 5 n=1 Tax=Erythranthe guttata TaxID=4155 RepID=UPI00064E11AE|nr:PREDICTED: MLO-like protein 5 [Erythranthe guttata]|eukprot:XP_012838251.1 PREDICTED: MLO-like protein 5 [Erythranthe guttata]
MAGGGTHGSRELDQTPTWAVSFVCSVIVIISIILEKTLHKIREGHIPIISVNGLHQLHIFIFFLAIFHVFYSAITMMLGRMKIREWKEWEREIANNTNESIDSAQFRLTHEDSFVKGHTSPWTKHPVLFYIVHLAPGTKFNFQKYIKRSLEDDFKVIVGIPPLLWTAAVVYLLVNVNGYSRSQAMFWLSVMPLVNAFEITYFIWITYEFGLYSCFHSFFLLAVIRICIGIGVQFLCSYITLPLYALVTQMGSHMKAAIFDEQTSRALMNWHKKAKKKKEGSQGRARKLGGSRENSPEKDSPAATEPTDETPPATGEDTSS